MLLHDGITELIEDGTPGRISYSNPSIIANHIDWVFINRQSILSMEVGADSGTEFSIGRMEVNLCRLAARFPQGFPSSNFGRSARSR